MRALPLKQDRHPIICFPRNIRQYSEEFEAERRKRRETAQAIEAFPEAERAELAEEAEAQTTKLPAWFGAAVRETYRRVALRASYERLYAKEEI